MNRWDRNLTILDQMWDRLLTVELIAEPLATCGAGDDVASVLRRMQEHNWNQIGFREALEQGGAVIGYLDHRDLNGLSGELSASPVRWFDVKQLISAQTPVRRCLQQLTDSARLFVLGPRGVDSVVTIADLQKQPVRMMLFGTISLLEMAMLARIKQLYPNQQWRELLSQPRLFKAEQLHRERRSAGHDTALADCLELCDRSDILTHHAADRAGLGFTSGKQCKKFFKRIERLRDNLAHVQDPTEVADWSTIGGLVFRCEELVRQLTRDES